MNDIRYKLFSNILSEVASDNNSENNKSILESRVDYCKENSSILEAYNVKLDMCTKDNISIEETGYMLSEGNEIIDSIIKPTFDNINDYCPWFTFDEIVENSGSVPNFEDIGSNNYVSKLKQLETERANATTIEEIESINKEMISLGWNPSVPVNEKSFEIAKSRQQRWLREHAPIIVDISKLDTSKSILESSTMMNKLYANSGLFPVYIVLSFTGTLFGKIIRKVKGSTYTHAGISLDSDLTKILTFKFGAEWNGFSIESLDFYNTVSDEAAVDVLCLFVDAKTRAKIQMVIMNFVAKQEKTKYGFGNLINILFNKAKKNPDPENLSLVCSQFVDTVLKIANVDITKKPSNLVIPQDFEVISTNPKIYKVYEGLAKQYSDKDVEKKLKLLFDTHDYNEIKYSDIEDFTVESYFYTTDNPRANVLLSEIQGLLTPEAVVFERKIPFAFSSNGDLTINTYKSLEDMYQESHKLLTTYTEKNIEGIKSELAKLFFINSTIEKKIKKMKNGDKNYKPMKDLRARVLNDFKTYFKKVIEIEPDFDFGKYFEKSDWCTGKITVDNSTLKFSGKVIKDFLKSQGV